MLQPVYSKGAFPAVASLLPCQAWSGLIGDCSIKLYAHMTSVCVTAQRLSCHLKRNDGTSHYCDPYPWLIDEGVNTKA